LISKRNKKLLFRTSASAASSLPSNARLPPETNVRHPDAAGRHSGGVNGLMAEILEDHIRLHMMNPDHEMESPEELGEDLIGLVRAYLK